uniref:D-alanyl-D-alanine carboxypeptidase family protein n=1 Tax=Candidatus Electronema sp. TaxID=2698783 RepID=UPI0040567B82
MTKSKLLLIHLLTACFLVVQLQAAAAVPLLSGGKKRAQAAGLKKNVSPAKKKAAVKTVRKAVKRKPAAAKKNVRAAAKLLAESRFKEQVQAAVSRIFKEAPAAAEVERQISSKSVMILDAQTGEPLFAKAPDSPRQPASTIKVLTGMIALKRLEEHEKVAVSSHAESMPRSKIYLNAGERYKADDLINAVLLASANDASVALAEKIAGSEEAFAKLMTLHARLWGAKNTICRTASGLTAEGQQSTARDLAEIFRHAMQDRDFAERMRRTKASTACGKTLRNHNKALWQVEGAVGGKTGYTSRARQTYVGQFKRGDDAIVVAIMGSETMWSDIKRLVEYGFQRKEQIRLAQLARSGRTELR